MKYLMSLFLLFSYQFIVAAKLTGPARLNKISLALTGQSATLQDQIEISKILNLDDQNIYLSNKVDQFFKSNLYTQKMTARLQELMQFNLPHSVQYESPGFNNQFKLNSTISLFNSLTINNLSWDQLLTAKNFILYPTSQKLFGERISDFGFYGNIFQLPNTSDGYVRDIDELSDFTNSQPIEVAGSNSETRLAGVLTTPHFFSRYSTTGLNKNRRRAAAIFRTFLCDKMSAAIPQSDKVDDATFNLLYPEKNNSTLNSAELGMTQKEIEIILNRKDEIHGTKADCRVCHSKLDPMGRVFQTSTAILGSYPSFGALFFKNSENKQINIEVNSVSELAGAIVSQPEYLKCQIQQFWNWFIGQDVTLTQEKSAILSTEFNQMGRKTNDFVKKLVLSEEFANRSLPNELTELASNTKSLLRRCQSCHDNSTDYLGVDLSRWPLGDQNDPKNNSAYWLTKISKSLDLKNNGLKRSMPPSPAEGGFIPTRQDLELIKKWIELGAPDESGMRQVK